MGGPGEHGRDRGNEGVGTVLEKCFQMTLRGLFLCLECYEIVNKVKAQVKGGKRY